MIYKTELRIRDVILVEIIIALIALPIGMIFTIKADTFALIMNILAIIIFLRKINLTKNRTNYLIQDFKENINVKEIIGRYINSSLLNLGLKFTIIGVFIFINTKFANEILNTSSAEEMMYSGNIIINVISVVIIAPILEEIIYRKVLFKRLAKKTNTIAGLVISSLIFGLSHATDSIVFATLFGVVLCILYKKYENILIPMFLHFINNLMSTIILLYPSEEEVSEIIKLTQQDSIIFIGLGITSSIVGIYFYIRFINKNKEYVKNIEQESI